MFETGKAYDFTFLSADDNGTYYPQREVWNVISVEGTLVKLHSPAVSSLYGDMEARTKIVNVSSPMFLEAALRPDRTADPAEPLAAKG